MVANASDTLVIEGQDAAQNNYTVSKPAVGSVAILDNISSNPGVTVTETSGKLGRLQIDTGGGSSQVTVSNTAGAITVPITYDGGTGINTLTVTGGIDTSDFYTPARSGPGLNQLAIGGLAEYIQFLNVAGVSDFVAGPLDVEGTNAANAINYSGYTTVIPGFAAVSYGLVSVDNYAPMSSTTRPR